MTVPRTLDMSAPAHPIMRYHGAKFRLAPWVIQHFPKHTTYVEPFGGAGGVLLQKQPSQSEVYNDLDQDIYNVFKVLQQADTAKKLQQLVAVTPYSRDEFHLAYEPTTDSIEQARRTLIRAHMGFGSAGATKGATGFRVDSAREYGTASQLWAQYPPLITEFCERLSGVIIENKSALEVISNHDRNDTLFYVDPPYVLSTRVVGGNRYYRHEMTDSDHQNLLDTLLNVKGMVVLSGYESDLYNEALSQWQKHSTTSRISAGRGTKTRTECLWINPAAASRQAQGAFDFGGQLCS